MAISIMNGAVLKFEIDFTVPAGTTLSKIDVKDTLELGLDVDKVECIVNDDPKTITDAPGPGYYLLTKTPFDGSSVPKANSSFILTITDNDVINNPAQDQNVKVIVYAKVEDFNSLPNDGEFTNEAHIIPYVGGVEAGDVSSDETVEFSEYKLYGFGGSDEIKRASGVNTEFPIHIPTFDAYSSKDDLSEEPELKYVVTLCPNNELGVNADANKISVYAYNADGQLTVLDKDLGDYAVELDGNCWKVTVPHSDELRSSTLYIVPNGDTTDIIGNYDDSRVYSPATLVLNDGDNPILTATPFDVTTIIDDDLITLVKKTLV